MTTWERVKERKRLNTHASPRDWKCLNEEHVLGPARCVNQRELRFHLRIDHGIGIQDVTTPLELGRVHLLAHTLIVFPELRELIGVGEKWDYR
jgi:hypothetical protein